MSEQKYSYRYQILHFLSGGLGACCAVTFTNPFELVKTRLQLQGELQRRSATTVRPYKNLGQAFLLILKHEGPLGLQKGLGAAYGYQLIMNGVRFGGYDQFKTLIGSDSVIASMFAAAMSGAIGAGLGSPLFLVKTRLQAKADGGIPQVGRRFEYKNALDGLRQIYKESGLRGLYRGNNAAALRTSIGSSVQLPTYDMAKGMLLKYKIIKEDGSLLHLSSSLISGFLVCLAMNPFDVVTTRMYSQPRDQFGRGLIYKGIGNCFFQILKSEGIHGLLKGFTAHYFRIGPHTILTFLFMEKIRVLIK